jgi:hypothetical protein
MANTRILQVFQCDMRHFAGSGRIAQRRAELVFFEWPTSELAVPAGRFAGGRELLRQTLGQFGAYTVSNFSITRVSASPARVHSWKAGNDIIVSM